MYFKYMWHYSTGITEKEFTNVEIQEQTASLKDSFSDLFRARKNGGFDKRNKYSKE